MGRREIKVECNVNITICPPSQLCHWSIKNNLKLVWDFRLYSQHYLIQKGNNNLSLTTDLALDRQKTTAKTKWVKNWVVIAYKFLQTLWFNLFKTIWFCYTAFPIAPTWVYSGLVSNRLNMLYPIHEDELSKIQKTGSSKQVFMEYTKLDNAEQCGKANFDRDQKHNLSAFVITYNLSS